MTPRCLALLGLLIAGAAATATATAAGSAPVVRTSGGAVRGTPGAIEKFLGIPYAAPPVGELRWREPAPLQPWSGVRDATHFGNDCWQSPWIVNSGQAYSEDCLTVNVWTPRHDRGARRPVLVFIYGGGFIGGTGAYAIYDGTPLARAGAVVVSFNYRVGILGFLAHPMLTAESPHHASGNYGLLDQLAALRWVNENIAAFGGDPRHITVFGESAGASSIAALLVSPLARNLFAGAIIQSPTLRAFPELAAAERAGAAVGADIAGLRRVDAASLLVHNFDFAPAQSADLLPNSFPSPIVDGYVLPVPPRAAFHSGAVLPVPTLVGSNADEGRMFAGEDAPATRAAYQGWVRAKFGALAPAVLAANPAADDAGAAAVRSLLIGDAIFAESARLIARGVALHQRHVYSYLFTRGMGGPAPPATHSEELPYVFGTLDAQAFIPRPKPVARDRALSVTLQRAWVRFAATGDPNGPGLPRWPAYRAATSPYIEFGDRVSVGAGRRSAQLDLMERFSDLQSAAP